MQKLHFTGRTTKIGRKPFDWFWMQTKCTICESINHWSQNCPDRVAVQICILKTKRYYTKVTLTHTRFKAMSETCSLGLLHCRASKTISKEWLNKHINNLDEINQQNIQYCFGHGWKIVKAVHSIIPTFTAKVLIKIKTGILGDDNNLLFLKS